MTMNELIQVEGGLSGMCKLFGWQGGTIHQVRAEIKRRMALSGIFYDKDGEARTLKIGKIK